MRPRLPPGPALRSVVGGLVAGGLAGVVFGLGSLNRPAVNAAVFGLLGAVAGAALAAAAVALARLVDRGRPSAGHSPGRTPSGRRADGRGRPDPSDGWGER